MRRRIMAILVALIVLASLCLTGCQSSESDPRESVVVVYSVFDDLDYGTIAWGHASGFFVGDESEDARYLITNYHVIQDFVDLGSGELGEYSVQQDDGTVLYLSGRSKVRVYFDSTRYEEAFLVAGDSSKDIAILKLAEPTTERKTLSLRVPTESMVGKPISVVGYPGTADNIAADSITAYGMRDATVTTGSVSRLLTTAGKGREDIQIDCNITNGNSGGPVLDSTGAVIGIAAWGYDSLNYAINISEAIPLLTQYSIPFTMASSVNSMVLIIAAAAVVVILVVVVILLLRKKSRPAKRAVSAKASAAVEQNVAPQKRPVVRSMAKVNAGATAEVNGKLVIGRSSACGLRFPENTPGVSGNHCVVEYDAATGDFIVTDIGSSYGTYLNGSERLVPHVPKRILARDRIALGDKDNIVIVDLV